MEISPQPTDQTVEWNQYPCTVFHAEGMVPGDFPPQAQLSFLLILLPYSGKLSLVQIFE